MSTMWQDIKDKAKSLVTRHGTEIGTVAKIAAHALMPGAPVLVGAVEALCDYSVDKLDDAQDQELAQMLEELGGDVVQLERVLEHLGGQLEGVISQMTMMASFTSPDVLEAMFNTALETQYTALRDEMRALVPNLESVKRQQVQMLRQQALQGDMLAQVQDSLDAALAFNAPLASEGIVGAQIATFLAARGRFQSALLNGDHSEAEQALADMRMISPNGNTYRVSEMAFKASIKDFEGAEKVAKTLIGSGAQDPRLQRAITGITALVGQSKRERLRQQQAQQQTQDSSPEQAIRLSQGSKIGDQGWCLKSLLGRGGMGEVWQVENHLGAQGALKLMHHSLGADPQFVRRFQDEIRALQGLSHELVIKILDWGCDQESGLWYFVMPFIKGMSLHRIMAQKKLNSAQVTRLALDLASALSTCHQKQIVHRDIKPENIMINEQGRPILIDFGIAHTHTEAQQTTMATPGYAPPEQLRGHKIEASADLYALGLTLAECLGDHVDEQWERLLAKLTHYRPQRRGSVQELLVHLGGGTQYHLWREGKEPQGPFGLKKVIQELLTNAQNVRLWWAKANGWIAWQEVTAVKEAYQKAQAQQARPQHQEAWEAPTPPPISEFRARHDPILSAEEEFKRAEAEAKQAFERAQQEMKRQAEAKANREEQARQEAIKQARLQHIEARREAMEWATRFFRGELQADELKVKLRACMQKGKLSLSDLPEAVRMLAATVGDRIEHMVGGVSFAERVIPAPPNGHPFWLMEIQVTQALYREVTGESPSKFKGDQLPVEQVSWTDGVAFCNELSSKLGLTPAYKGTDNNCDLISGANGFRLPFEAEWEFAAEGGQSFKYASSDNINEVAWYRDNSGQQTHEVGKKKPNGYGVYDMSGNVWEWCADDFDNPGQHRLGASRRAYRGGGWSDYAVSCEVSLRSRGSPDLRGFDLGLRLSRSLG